MTGRTSPGGGAGRCARRWTPSGRRRIRLGSSSACCPTPACSPPRRTARSIRPSSRRSAGRRPPGGPCPKAGPSRLVIRLLSDPGVLAAAADGVLDPAEQQAICWETPARGPASARWSPADAVLVDEAADLIERIPSLAHVVVDEAQDLSPMECRAVGRRCATGSATLLGDLAPGP